MRIWLNVSTHLNTKIMSYNYISQSLHSNLRLVYIYTLHLYFLGIGYSAHSDISMVQYWLCSWAPLWCYHAFSCQFCYIRQLLALALEQLFEALRTILVESSFVSSVSQNTIKFDFLSSYFVTDFSTLTADLQSFSSRSEQSMKFLRSVPSSF